MAGETLGEPKANRVCPEIGRICVEGECPGRQEELVVSTVPEGEINMLGFVRRIENRTVRKIEWCGQEAVPPEVQHYRQFSEGPHLDKF